MEEEKIKKLLQENIKYSKEILKLSVKIRRYIFFAQIMTVIKIIIIVVPIILAFIYLPPYLEDLIEKLNDLLLQRIP